jgi:hypothetical protein
MASVQLSSHGVRASAGSLRGSGGVALRHAWTEDGVDVGPLATGAQALHLSVALCVLNDTYREAARLGIAVAGVAVEADGGFDDAWCSTGIAYAVELDSAAPPEQLARLRRVVDEVAEVPRALRAGADVESRDAQGP